MPSVRLPLSMRLILPALFTSGAHSLVAPTAPEGRHGFSLLQRWASPPKTQALELSSEELTTYIATGRLPAQVLAQLHSPAVDSKPPTSVEDRAKQEEMDYNKKADMVLGEMKDYEKKMEDVRLNAQAAYKKTTEQEKRLSANFRNASQLLDGLIQKAAHEASEAEVQTMLERLQRIHYKQVGTLDRSATYWLELAEKEREVRHVAEAQGRLEASSAGGRSSEMRDMQEATTKEKAEMDKWFKDYWAQLEKSEKEALQKRGRSEEKPQEPKEEPCEQVPDKIDQVPVKVEATQEAMVPVQPGAIVPNSNSPIVKSDATVM